MRSIPIDVIRAFVAVVEARGFTRAAEELGRSQPTVSLQVKRLEELVEAPLFERAARFELTAVGSVCFEYGKRLVRLHDELLEETDRRRAPDARLRIGMASEFVARLAPLIAGVNREGASGAGLEVVAGESEALALAFEQGEIDVAVLLSRERPEKALAHWRAPGGWYAGAEQARKPPKSVRLVLPPQGAALHEAAVSALRAAERPFEIVCLSADFAVRSAAASTGLGVAPMIEGLAPVGLEHASDKSLPPLPDLIVSLLARGDGLAASARRWAEDAFSALKPL